MADGSLAPRQALVYCDTLIRDRGEMLSLTDMWRAAGSDAPRQPAEWLRSAQARDFIDFILGNLGISQDEAIQQVRGGSDPGTWAHWQIAMAYAKYLSPAFHAWCNEVVRAHMERRPAPAWGAPAPVVVDVRAVAAEFGRVMREELHGAMEPVREELSGLGRRVGALERAYAGRRRAITDGTKAEHLRDTHDLGGMCPCCSVRRVTNSDSTKAPHAQFDHFYASSQPTGAHTWLICRPCHDDLTNGRAIRTDREAEFRAYQSKRSRLPGRQQRLV